MAFGFSEPAGSPLHWGFVAPDPDDLDDLYDPHNYLDDDDELDEEDEETWSDEEDLDEAQKEWDGAIDFLMGAMQ